MSLPPVRWSQLRPRRGCRVVLACRPAVHRFEADECVPVQAAERERAWKRAGEPGSWQRPEQEGEPGLGQPTEREGELASGQRPEQVGGSWSWQQTEREGAAGSVPLQERQGGVSLQVGRQSEA